MTYGSALPAMVDIPAKRKARGAFYTPPELASFLVDFAIQSKTTRVLEPSCGEAEFLVAAVNRLRELGADPCDISHQIVGCELHPTSAAAAKERLRLTGIGATILSGDFFERNPGEEDVGTFDAIIGNPPYIRYQAFSGKVRARAMECALAAGVCLSSLASSWAPFLAHATRFLRKGGCLAFVLPAELLSSNYAAPIRRFLLNSFQSVRLTLFEKKVFPEVQEEVVLLRASGFHAGSTDSLRLSQVNSSRDLSKISENNVYVAASQRWPFGTAAVAASRLLAPFEGDSLVPLEVYGAVHLGAVTGANSYFALSKQDMAAAGLGEGDVISLCPTGSRHLRSLSFTDEDHARFADRGVKAYLFYPGDNPSLAARKYIELGERRGTNNAYKCRSRSPWWKVSGVTGCDLFFTYMNGAGPNLCQNEAGVSYLNSVHGITLRQEIKTLGLVYLPLVALSSASLLSAELVGRSYGGGVLKLEPREAAKMLLPSPDVVRSCTALLDSAKPQVEKLLRKGERDAATLLVDDAIMPSLGFSEEQGRISHGLLMELRNRRAGRSGKLKLGSKDGNR